ncbi:basal body-orientation factor 1 [Sinocyclocheilus anshuiensis]|uniref:Basal body-orientation factor 1 n=1 Tax=Sinocyclocheilus anshuiensis TaxID=1608454 RepID=A0A671LKL1_9TELE|nr:PREDICTED: basal body-orientation factor 1-like [Sinocyclocheilus anshuiensis]
MPKKKGNKGKGKGKGKKEGKHESKADKESDIEKFKSNADLWEAKFNITEISRVEYREATRALSKANEELANQQYRAEKDTNDIIAFLKRTDREKTATIAALEEQLKREKVKALQEKHLLVAEYMQKIDALEEKFKQRSSDFQRMQGELKTIKHFRKIKANLEEDLISMREKMYIADRGHQESLATKEYKFYTARIHLEKEAEQKITQLAEQAHHEAIAQLGTASHTVFKENVRLNEALNYYVKEAEELKSTNITLKEKNASLALLKETNELMRKEGDSQMRSQQNEISELRAKLVTLEQALGIMSGEFEQEREEVERRAMVSMQANSADLERLEMLLAAREKELGQVKRLAQSIIEQRKELELFFHEALDHVRKEIKTQQHLYRQEALKAYRWRMNEARAGRLEYPRIRTFSNAPHSTNDVQTDLEEADKWSNLKSSSVDISDLTWEQKERLLNLLFAKFNGHKTRKPAHLPALSTSSSEKIQVSSDAGFTEEKRSLTFITQMPMPSMTSDSCVLPALKST